MGLSELRAGLRDPYTEGPELPPESRLNYPAGRSLAELGLSTGHLHPSPAAADRSGGAAGDDDGVRDRAPDAGGPGAGAAGRGGFTPGRGGAATEAGPGSTNAGAVCDLPGEPAARR